MREGTCLRTDFRVIAGRGIVEDADRGQGVVTFRKGVDFLPDKKLHEMVKQV